MFYLLVHKYKIFCNIKRVKHLPVKIKLYIILKIEQNYLFEQLRFFMEFEVYIIKHI